MIAELVIPSGRQEPGVLRDKAKLWSTFATGISNSIFPTAPAEENFDFALLSAGLPGDPW